MIPVVETGLLFSSKDSNILHTSEATGTKSVTWVTSIDLDLVKAIKNRLGCTVNDVLLGCLSKSLSDYFTELNADCPENVSLLFPLDIRSSPEEAKEFHNKLAAVILRLPTKQMDLISAIQETKSRMNYVKTSGEPISSALSWQFVSFLLPRFLSKVFVTLTVNKATGSVSNLIGPHRTIIIGKQRLESVVFWPPQSLHHCFGAAFCSYNGRIMVGVEGDHATLKDPRRIADIYLDNMTKLAFLPQEMAKKVKKLSDTCLDNPGFEMVEDK